MNNKKEKIEILINMVGRFFIGAIFCYSGFSKLIQPIEFFEVSIHFYELVPDRFVHGIALIIPWIELIFGAYLLLGYWRKGSAGVLAGLTGIFQIVLAQALIRGLSIDECGCFGGGLVHLTLFQSFFLDTVLVLTLIRIATSDGELFSLDRLLKRG